VSRTDAECMLRAALRARNSATSNAPASNLEGGRRQGKREARVCFSSLRPDGRGLVESGEENGGAKRKIPRSGKTRRRRMGKGVPSKEKERNLRNQLLKCSAAYPATV